MNCPKCNSPFGKREVGDVLVDECTQCHGLWFDQEELRQAKDTVESDLRWMDVDLWKDQELFHVEIGALICPRCNVQMAAIRYGPTNVTVDTCAKCRGVWLDKGEFEQIIDALEEDLASMTASEYERMTLKQARELISGKERFISEWHDLVTVWRLMQYRVLVENPKVRDAIVALNISSPFH